MATLTRAAQTETFAKEAPRGGVNVSRLDTRVEMHGTFPSASDRPFNTGSVDIEQSPPDGARIVNEADPRSRAHGSAMALLR